MSLIIPNYIYTPAMCATNMPDACLDRLQKPEMSVTEDHFTVR